jgi:hypothetical protein
MRVVIPETVAGGAERRPVRLSGIHNPGGRDAETQGLERIPLRLNQFPTRRNKNAL